MQQILLKVPKTWCQFLTKAPRLTAYLISLTSHQMGNTRIPSSLLFHPSTVEHLRPHTPPTHTLPFSRQQPDSLI